MDELRSMRAFVNVVEVGSFAGAARRMKISPSVITKRINQLEDHLNVELLRRSTRQLTVTDMGSAYFERCVRILSEVDEAQAAVNTMNWGLSGLFRISCAGSFASSYMARDVCEFQLLHPELKIDFRQNDHVYDPIQEGYDLCIQPKDIINDAITKRPIVPLHRVLVATPDYLKKYGEPEAPHDLKDYRIALNNFITPDNEIEIHRDGAIVVVPINPVLLTNSIWLLRAAVLEGECIAMVPIFYFADELAAGSVVPVLRHYRLPMAELSAYYRRSPHVPMKIRSFINFALEKYSPTPPWIAPILEGKPELAAHFAPE
jgi:DNA-binding transcriptional LysR family regulator